MANSFPESDYIGKADSFPKSGKAKVHDEY